MQMNHENAKKNENMSLIKLFALQSVVVLYLLNDSFENKTLVGLSVSVILYF